MSHRPEVDGVERVPTLAALVSVGSKMWDRETVHRIRDWCTREKLCVQFIILDKLEAHNLAVFEGLSETTAQERAFEKAADFAASIDLQGPDAQSWLSIADYRRLPNYSELVQTRFKAGGSFRRHCLNETFSNLYPKFMRIGVRRKSDPRVQRACQYLLEELAFKICSFETGLFDGEVLPHRESALVRQIYSGRYFDCQVNRLGFQLVELFDESFSTESFSRQRV